MTKVIRPACSSRKEKDNKERYMHGVLEDNANEMQSYKSFVQRFKTRPKIRDEDYTHFCVFCICL